MLEVNLEYPDEIHDAHDNFASAPDKMVINRKKWEKRWGKNTTLSYIKH